LGKGTIEKVIAKSDAELGLAFLLNPDTLRREKAEEPCTGALLSRNRAMPVASREMLTWSFLSKIRVS
jgi:hypothetical protein